MKVCDNCNRELPLDSFEYNKTKKVYRRICRRCRNIQVMEARYSTLENHLKRKLSRLKERSKRLNIPFNLTYDDLLSQLEKQKHLCFYTDEPLVFYEYKKIPNRRLAPSVDKIIPEKGYVKGNIVWCIDRINSIKYDVTLEEMRLWMPDWYRRIMEYVEF